MLKKFASVVCMGLMTVAFVGCEAPAPTTTSAEETPAADATPAEGAAPAEETPAEAPAEGEGN